MDQNNLRRVTAEEEEDVGEVRVEEAEAVVEDWISLTGDTGARENFQSMLRQLEAANDAADSAAQSEESPLVAAWIYPSAGGEFPGAYS